MRKYRNTAATRQRVAYAVELSAGLRQFDETRALAAPLDEATSALVDAAEAAAEHRDALPALRAQMRTSEYRVDQLLRQIARAAELADEGRRGAVFAAVFPQGLTPVVAPRGVQQVPTTHAFLNRFVELGSPGAQGLRDQYLAPLREALAGLESTATAYAATREAASKAFAKELVLRDEHELMVVRIMGYVRAAFPKDKGIQRAIFPVVSQSRGAENDDLDAAEDDVALDA